MPSSVLPTHGMVTFLRTKSRHAAAQPARAGSALSSARTRRSSGAATAQGAYSSCLRWPSALGKRAHSQQRRSVTHTQRHCATYARRMAILQRLNKSSCLCWHSALKQLHALSVEENATRI